MSLFVKNKRTTKDRVSFLASFKIEVPQNDGSQWFISMHTAENPQSLIFHPSGPINLSLYLKLSVLKPPVDTAGVLEEIGYILRMGCKLLRFPCCHYRNDGGFETTAAVPYSSSFHFLRIKKDVLDSLFGACRVSVEVEVPSCC